MLNDAQRFWDAIVGKVRRTAQDESKNALRLERYEVTTAANGTKMGVTLPMGTKEIFLPYSNEVASASVGTPVLVGWWGSMSNAKVCYFADGYRGGDLLANRPVGSTYESTLPTSPAELFGGTWEQIKDVFTLAAGDTYTAGSTGGEATHLLTGAESGQKALTNVGSHHHPAYFRRMTANSYVTSGGAIVWGSSSNNNGTWDTNNATISIGASNAASAHNNMPPYLVVYKWKRVA